MSQRFCPWMIETVKQKSVKIVSKKLFFQMSFYFLCNFKRNFLNVILEKTFRVMMWHMCCAFWPANKHFTCHLLVEIIFFNFLTFSVKNGKSVESTKGGILVEKKYFLKVEEIFFQLPFCIFFSPHTKKIVSNATQPAEQTDTHCHNSTSLHFKPKCTHSTHTRLSTMTPSYNPILCSFPRFTAALVCRKGECSQLL